MKKKEIQISSNLKKKLSLISIFFIIVSFPVNDQIFLFFRFQDFFVMFFMIINFDVVRREELKLVFIILIILIFTNLIGSVYFDSFYFNKLAFFYKILIPIIFFFQIDNFLNSKNIEKIQNFLDIGFIIFLTYIFATFQINIDFLVPKTIFPGTFEIFSQQLDNGDRHLVGALVGIFFSIKLIYLLKEKKYIASVITYIIFLNSLYVFQSRGLALFFLISVYLTLNHFFKSTKFKQTIQLSLYVLIIIFFFIFFDSNLNLKRFNLYELKMLFEIIEYPIVELGPHSNRITAFFSLVPENYIFLFTGVGFTYYKFIFIDNGLVFILFSFGIIPLIFLMYYIKKYFNFKLTSEYSINILILVTIILNLFVSEFVLVSRFIFLVLIMYKYSSIKSELLISKKINQK